MEDNPVLLTKLKCELKMEIQLTLRNTMTTKHVLVLLDFLSEAQSVIVVS